MKKHQGQSTDYQRLGSQAEERLRDKAGDVSGEDPDDIQKLIKELEVHQIELEMQYDELRSTQINLVESRDQYHELYDFAPVGYFTLDEKTRIRQVNLTGADLLGIQRSKLINTKFSRFISAEFQDDFYFHCKRIFESGTKQACDLKLIKHDGTLFDVRLESIAVKDKVAASGSIRTAVTDITDRKRIEKTMQKAHDELEKRVEERTAELAKSNVSLMHEIAERRRLSYRFLNAQEDERRRIASELHDELEQDLSVLKLQFDSLKTQLSESEIALNDPIESISATISNTIEKVRGISRELIPSVLIDRGLAPALRWLIQSLAEHSNIEISSKIILSEDLFPTEQQIAIYRIFQEIFTNIRKHTQATQVSISIGRDDRKVVFRVEDNGIGFDMERVKSISAAERGLGLVAMEKRVKMLDGNFEIFSRVGTGTRIVFEIPIASQP